MTQPTRHEDESGRRKSGKKNSPSHRKSRPDRHDTSQSNSDQPDQSAQHNLNVPQTSDAVSAVQRAVGEADFQHWFATRSRFTCEGDHLVVEVPNPFILNWLMKRFRSALVRAAHDLLGPSASFQLRVNASLQQSAAVPPAEDSNGNAATAAKAVVSSAARRNRRSQTEAGHRNESQPTSGRRRFRSFDTFVRGESNELAALAARQVASVPGEKFNPLYLYGGTGTGKTHLLEAIYSDARRRHKDLNVVYLTSEGFTNYFTAALSARTIPSFRQRFRNVDVMLIDNVEFLDNKRATQEEFLHTIVQVIEHGGQVVISSDRHPRMLTRHREELTTRFLSGLVCRIESPDDQLRQQLVRTIATQLNADFSEEALDYVARRCRRNIRELQGAMNSLDGHHALTGKRITVQLARQVLGDLEEESRRLVRISDVERVVCEAFGVTATELRSKTRRKAISLPRSLAMYISRKLTHSAYREIGLYFGGRDHSTVVAAEKRVFSWINHDEPVKVPTSCKSRTISGIVSELEDRLMAMAS